MRRVMVVDDEPIIVEGLLAVLSKSGLDIDLYSASGGEEALSLLNDIRMDAVISDIRMPGMDGLQLMERIRADWPMCRILFLSGYNEFDAVYRAIQSPSVSFLLKTEGFDRIVSALKDALAAVEREAREKETREALTQQQALARHMLQREALSPLVAGEADALSAARLSAAGLHIRAEAGVLPLYSYVESGAENLPLEAFHEKLIRLDQMLRALLSPYPIELAFWNRRENLLWLMQPASVLPAPRAALYIKESLELLQESARTEIGLCLAFSMDAAPVPLSALPGAYEALRMRACQSLGMPGMIALRPPEAARGGGAPLVSEAALEKLKELLEHQNRAEFLPLLEKETRALRETDDMGDPYALEAYTALFSMYLSYVNRWGLHDRVRAPGGIRGLASAARFSGWKQAADALVSLGEGLLREGGAEQGGRAQAVVREIQAHIERSLGDPDALSLARIAEKLYFNPAYLSRLFKQTTGETISDYVSLARVRKANELLADPKCKIGDAGRAVGFSSSANFARFYRKMMNCTPQEYRERNFMRGN